MATSVPDWGEDDRVTGYWFLPQQARFEPAAELAHFLAKGSPLVYIGFGGMPLTHAYRTVPFVDEVLAATRTRAVLVKGWGRASG